jgi:hypothetical protein
VKKASIYIFLLLIGTAGFAQRPSNNVISLNFPDSVRIILENTKSIDASVIGGGFAAAWNNMSMEQQQAIRSQVRMMKAKKFPVKPALINYFGALLNAVTIENVDSKGLTEYLNVAGKVIDKQTPAKANVFLGLSRTFFKYHALHYEKSFRLGVTDDSYSFEYIEPLPPIAWDDTTQLIASTEATNVTDDSNGYSDSVVTEFVSPWMNPTPPPTLEGAVIKFPKATLTFSTSYDSVSLKNTKGAISLLDNTFVGEGGTFDWTPAQLHPDSVYCNFTSYFFNANKPELKADLVKLTYIGRTPGAIPGSFEFKSQPRKDSVASTYPRFKSYESNLNILGIGDKNVKYTGGFSLIGNKITSESFNQEPAKIEVSREGNLKFVAKSPAFVFGPSVITSNRAQINIIQGNDSIVHQAVRLKYAYPGDSIQHLILQKDKGNMRNTPYASSFFNIDFSGDVLRWDLAKDSLNIQTDGGRNTVPLVIESTDYYDPEDYRILRGEGFSFHALGLVVSYALKNGVTQFYSGEIATATGRDLMEIKKAVIFLYEKGLLIYNERTDVVQLKQKAIDLYKAFKGQLDYDNLKIHSVIDSFPNATINFKKHEMTVRGVEEFEVSDSLNVRIKPDSSVITLLQNRDIKFNGTIDAGNFKISGKGFTLRYDSFLIDLTHIDSVNFFVIETNAKGQQIRRKINNSLVGTDSTSAAVGGITGYDKTSGTLFISKANNKSGKEKIPNYPRLDASAGGVIYFDRPEVLSGVYDRSMFFVVPPFKLDSLNDADPTSINFDGTFVSSGMFPNFKEKLHTQPDKSLGFSHEIPPGGYQLYKGDGTMDGVLNLDTKGLRGQGTIHYLAAHINSEDFIYYPDSVIARGQRAVIEKKQFGNVLFPQASLRDFEMKWTPKSDKMILKNKKAPFSFYDSTAQLQGQLTISKNGVAGMGRFETRGTELVSRDMRFTGDDFSARHGRFKVRTSDPDKPLFTGNDIRLKFNLTENYADISPEVEGVAAIDFPYAQVKTSIQKARWDIDEQKIIMSKDPSVDIENSYFYTTRKELDSLHFNADHAEYNLKTQELKVSGIPYIIVADAKITPENNEVLILENARIGTLKNTTIVLDTLNGYHLLTNGVVDIVSRKEFSGYATYQYINLLSDTFAIKMTDFHLEPIAAEEQSRRKSKRNSIASMQTVATGAVSENEKIVLGAGLYYKGDLIMYATRPALQLDGYVKLDIRNIPNYNAWLKYAQSGEETEVLIDFANAVTEEGKRASAGLHIGTDRQFYITFFNDKTSDDDEDIFKPEGVLIYDKEINEYRIEDREKAAGNKLAGKLFAYNDEKKTLRFEGPMDIFNGGKDFNVTTSAIGHGNLETHDYKMNALVIMDSNVPQAAFDVMAQNLQNVIKNEGVPEGLGDQTELLYKVANVVGEKFARDFETRSQAGYVSLSTVAPLVKPLVFSDVNLKWHPELKAFYSEGLIGTSHSGKLDINGGFEGFMEIRKTEDGASVFHVFFKASPESWYYFGFEDNRLMVHSSVSEFNSIIARKTNAGKAKIGEVAFIPGTDEEVLAFVNKFRKNYYGIDVPYNLNEGAQVTEEKKKGEKKEDDDDGF